MAENLKIDTYLSRISHVSQFVLVAFAIFGYFYTVRPIYQKEQLSEDIARKEVELSNLRKDLERSTLSLSEHAGREDILKASIASLEKDFKKSNDELVSVRKEVDESRKELTEQRNLTNKVVSINRVNSKDLYFENFSGVALSYFLRNKVDVFNATSEQSSLSSFERFKRMIVTPYAAINYAIENKEDNTIGAVKNVPTKLKGQIVDYIKINANRDKNKLNVYPADLEEVFNNYKKKKADLVGNDSVELILSNRNVDLLVFDYLSKVNKNNMKLTEQYINSIGSGFK